MWEMNPSDVTRWREEAGISRDFSMTEFLKERMQTETTKRDERPERTAEENEVGYAEILRIKEELEYGRSKVPKVTNGVDVIGKTQDSEIILVQNLEARANAEPPPRKVYKLMATIERHEKEAAEKAALRKKRFLPLVVIGGITSGIIINGISIANMIYDNNIITISNSGYQDRSTFTNPIPQHSTPKDTILPSPVPEGARIYYAKAGEKLDSIAIHNNASLIEMARLNPTAKDFPLPDSFVVYIPLKEHPIHSGKYTKADSVIANTPTYSGQRQQFAEIKPQTPKNNNYNNLHLPRNSLRR